MWHYRVSLEAFERLEPCARKRACTVLRGGSSSNAAALLDRLQRGWMYLVAILDWYSRYIVSWELSETLEIDFVLICVDRALAGAVPTIFNSDQGSHFTSPRCVDRVLAAGASVSMDGRGRAMDNIYTERLWRTVKYEHVYLNDYAAPREARQGIGKYLHFYCNDRPHQSLEYRRPVEVYRAMGSSGSR